MLAALPIGIEEDPRNLFARNKRRFTILPETRRKHVAMFGATGAGKSTLLRNMIACDIAAGVGITVVDPHGDLCNDILDNHIPKLRANDVIYFNAKDRDRALGLNLLECRRPEQRGLVVSDAVNTFRTIWADSWGPRMEDILRNALYALVEQPTPQSLLALPKLLTDGAYRASVLARVQNPVVLDFFHNRFDRWNAGFREEAISAVLNKCRAFLTDPLVRSVIGQARSSFDFRWMMDHHKILLCDLSKGSIGGDNARLLGSLIVIKEKLAALSRQDIPEAERVSHVLYVEEAQNFVADFASILQEARKYRLTLTLATQGIEQLSKEASSAVFSNCATLIAFRVSNTDATRLHDEFTMVFPAANLQDLADYKAYVRTLSRRGDQPAEPSGPHVIAMYPPFSKEPGNADRAEVIRTSIERYTRPRAAVEAQIARFLQRAKAA